MAVWVGPVNKVPTFAIPRSLSTTPPGRLLVEGPARRLGSTFRFPADQDAGGRAGSVISGTSEAGGAAIEPGPGGSSGSGRGAMASEGEGEGDGSGPGSLGGRAGKSMMSAPAEAGRTPGSSRGGTRSDRVFGSPAGTTGGAGLGFGSRGPTGAGKGGRGRSGVNVGGGFGTTGSSCGGPLIGSGMCGPSGETGSCR